MAVASFSLGETTDAPDILVHPNVVLEFAPGAVLVPLNYAAMGVRPRTRAGREDEAPLVIIEIQGAIDAGLHEIFATTLHPRNDDTLEIPVRAGKVIFTGNQVREVYPEWWGVLTQQSGHWGVRNRRAFQAAIDAGHTDRYRLRRQPDGALVSAAEPRWRQEATIPVVAMYEYFIEGTLRVGAEDATPFERPNPAPFVMLGGCEPTVDNTTLRALPGASNQWDEIRSDAPQREGLMLAMTGVSSFYFEGVSFDANNALQGVLDITLGPQGGRGEFKRCTFKNLSNTRGATLVAIRSAKDGVDNGEDAVHLAFTVCRMTPILLNYRPLGDLDVPGNVPGSIIYAERVRGMLLDYGDRCSIELRGCHLQGVCDPMIHARQGRFALNECVFHGNRRVHTTAPTSPPSSVTIAEWRRFWNSTSGTDIFIDRPFRAASGKDAAPASFTARELESQSFQFVSTWMDAERPETRSQLHATGSYTSYVLINAHHTAAPAGSHEGDESQGDARGGGADPQPMPPEQFRPSMSWEGPGQLGCHLVALGCCFKNTYLGQGMRFSSSLGGIRLGPNHRGTIFHVANTTADDSVAVEMVGVPNRRGAFRNTAEAVAPSSFIQWLPEAAPGGEGIREPVLFGLDVWPVQR